MKHIFTVYLWSEESISNLRITFCKALRTPKDLCGNSSNASKSPLILSILNTIDVFIYDSVLDDESSKSWYLLEIISNVNMKIRKHIKKMKRLREKVQVKDRFHKMRLFSKCFLGLDAAEIFEDDQHCSREEVCGFIYLVVLCCCSFLWICWL